ncbi:SEC13 [Auxenochlorella protothecoides x Auxenochlorella symbiontica]
MAATVVTQFETGHQDAIHDAAYDYYGKRLATCSSDRGIKVFEIEGEQVTHLADLHGHDGPVWEVAWAHPSFGTLLASASFDGRVAVWGEVSPASWQQVHLSAAHSASVNSVAWAPPERGLMLAAASSDGALSVHSATADGGWAAERLEGAHPPGAAAVSWSPDGLRLVSGGCDGVARVWRRSASTGAWAQEGPALAGHADWVRDVAWAPALGAPGATLATAGQDGRVYVWSEAAPGRWDCALLHDFSPAPVWRLSWAVSGNVLAVTDGTNAVTLWKEALEGQWEKLGGETYA